MLGNKKNPLVPEVRNLKSGMRNQRIPSQSDQPDSPKQHSAPGTMRSASIKPLAEKTIEDVLLHFGETKRVARRRYREFVKNGIDQGKRPELQGGGLIRSSGGDKAGLLGQKKEEREKGDARILGSGDFVVQALKRANELHERSIKSRISLNELIKRVSKDRSIDLKALISSKRKKDISNTRAIISYLAAIELRHSGAKIASELRLMVS